MLLNLPGKSEKILENLHEVAFFVGGRGQSACMTETRAGSGFFQDAFSVSYTYFPVFYKALLALLILQRFAGFPLCLTKDAPVQSPPILYSFR